jgi:serine/threonine-protein kinase
MGRVYLAQDTRLSRRVALKILSPERVNNPRAIQRFQREARVGAQLQHENLVRIYDFGESSGRYYLVMEYIEGDTIGTMLSREGNKESKKDNNEHGSQHEHKTGKLPPAIAVGLVRQVAMGLEHAHRKGLIHRDVNPYNILVTRDGIAKLADLGLALDLAEADRVTREGATVGTFDYVAPEQARQSHSADIRSDIYSLGCSLYHMCSGQVPFPTPSLPEKLFAHQAMEPTPLGKLVPDLPEGLAEVIQRMMRKSPEERYSTPLQVAQALEPFADNHSIARSRDEVELLKSSAASESASSRSIEGKARSREPGGNSIAASLGSVQSVGLKTPPDPTVDRVAEPEVKVASTIKSPVSSQGSDPEFPLDLILGPEPSLTEGLSRPKSRLLPSKSESSYVVTTRTRLPRPVLWGLIALTVIALTAAAVMAFFNPFADRGAREPRKPPSRSLNKNAESSEGSSLPRDDRASSVKVEPAIVVRIDGEKDQEFAGDKLFDAIQKAMGGRGWVELRNTKPLRFTSTSHKPLDFTSARGSLVIRAAPGAERIIDLELSGPKPFLATGSSMSLVLDGVTFEVCYSETAGTPAAPPPALISVAGKSKFERCAFKVASTFQPKCRALFASMGALEVARCWFEGFDEAIDVDAGYSTQVRISQTMIVPTPSRFLMPPQLGEWYGWGVKLMFKADERPPAKANQPKPNLIFEHCTFEGAGLLDLAGSPGPAPIQLAVSACAFRANTLLALNSQRPKQNPQFQWVGTGNQYDILGPIWIVHSTQGTPAFSTDVIDLDSWLRFTPGEKQPIRNRLNYEIDSAKRSVPARPREFAIQAPAAPQPRPGADPALVGPWSSP